ncbi:hypothetical protein V8E51_002752 [Hyaloscypha variabilis]
MASCEPKGHAKSTEQDRCKRCERWSSIVSLPVPSLPFPFLSPSHLLSSKCPSKFRFLPEIRGCSCTVSFCRERSVFSPHRHPQRQLRRLLQSHPPPLPLGPWRTWPSLQEGHHLLPLPPHRTPLLHHLRPLRQGRLWCLCRWMQAWRQASQEEPWLQEQARSCVSLRQEELPLPQPPRRPHPLPRCHPHHQRHPQHQNPRIPLPPRSRR